MRLENRWLSKILHFWYQHRVLGTYICYWCTCKISSCTQFLEYFLIIDCGNIGKANRTRHYCVKRPVLNVKADKTESGTCTSVTPQTCSVTFRHLSFWQDGWLDRGLRGGGGKANWQLTSSDLSQHHTETPLLKSFTRSNETSSSEFGFTLSPIRNEANRSSMPGR